MSPRNVVNFIGFNKQFWKRVQTNHQQTLSSADDVMCCLSDAAFRNQKKCHNTNTQTHRHDTNNKMYN